MGGDLLIELITQDDHIRELARQPILITSVVPDLRFTEEIESRSLNHLSRRRKVFCAKEHCRAKDAFERSNQPTILFSAFMHAKRVEHFSGGSELDRLTALPHGQGRQENRNNTILAEGKTLLRVARDLQNKLSVSSFVKQLIRRQATHRQTT